jgi:hypothetical protein
VTILRPDITKKPVVSLDVSVPVNCEPSDIVTAAVASNVPAAALSTTVVLAGVSVIAVGEGAGLEDGGGGGEDADTPSATHALLCHTHQFPSEPAAYIFPPFATSSLLPKPFPACFPLRSIGQFPGVPSGASNVHVPSAV